MLALITNPQKYDTMLDQGSFTYLQVEASLCLWEHYLEHIDARYPDIDALRERIGTVELRQQFMTVAILNACSDGIALARENGFEDPFDWEFCPLFLSLCVTVEGHRLTLRPGWRGMCKHIK